MIWPGMENRDPLESGRMDLNNCSNWDTVVEAAEDRRMP